MAKCNECNGSGIRATVGGDVYCYNPVHLCGLCTRPEVAHGEERSAACQEFQAQAHSAATDPQERIAELEAALQVAREAGTALLDALEYCHHCGGQLALDEPLVSHCESCSCDCDDHDEPECTPIYVLHDRLRKALARIEEVSRG